MMRPPRMVVVVSVEVSDTSTAMRGLMLYLAYLG